MMNRISAKNHSGTPRLDSQVGHIAAYSSAIMYSVMCCLHYKILYVLHAGKLKAVSSNFIVLKSDIKFRLQLLLTNLDLVRRHFMVLFTYIRYDLV